MGARTATWRRPARPLAAALALAAVAIALGDDGGYSRASREHFAAAAFAALLAAAASDWPRTRRLARHTQVLWMLAALAVLGAASTAWTTGIRADAWHWGLTAAAYAALLLAAAVLARDERDVARAAGALCVMAV